MSRLTIVVAATKANGIGVNGGLPWKLSKELKYFAQVTTKAPEGQQNAVIMGRNTWESIPSKFRPLPRRKNIVISRSPNYELGAPAGTTILANSLKSALDTMNASSADGDNKLNRGFIIGGANLYNESLALRVSTTEPCVDRILLTRILSPAFDNCDVFMPDFLDPGTPGERGGWTQASHAELEEWVGFTVPQGTQEEDGVQYEFQMWVRGG
ncbi:hypothetical protein D9619_003285 [Psilocybe cf. subviscida]|uniref:Dihydrofolate reductase n=1 Tax=Psilocybe cf. subviscida TaxID=2480587 RepID=A0A8H5EUP0_9AGAR|nr:hypothetical protein D9619_003285 [Psilocybe cf. subviscida]